jgi:hypothetical protein
MGVRISGVFGAIVLRDVPKEQALIDLSNHKIQGGFRGFRMVPPGVHYVAVKSGQRFVGFWCWLDPNEAVVRVFDAQKGFVEDAPESAERYAQMALSGAMDRALIPYAMQQFGPWFGLISHIGKESFPPQIHAQDAKAGAGSRFDNAFLGTHGGDAGSFLAEFQFAFVNWMTSMNTATPDEVASARWRHLVQAAYNAGEDRVKESGNLFVKLVDTLLAQFKVMPDQLFKSGSFLVQHADYLAEDMIDTGITELVEKGRAFAAYLEKRVK